MKRLSLLMFLLMFSSTSIIWSQNKSDAFLYIDSKPVDSEEFVRLYQKNLEVITDQQQNDLDNYLELYIAYKLKLAEARRLGLDKENEYVKEITTYRKEQTLRHLEQSQLSANIREEIYNRSKKEVHASHILVNLPAYSYGKDTVKAYDKIKEIRNKALAGEDFNQLAVKYSDEPGVENSKGDLGYFSTMQMVKPFEDAAYTTPIGEISPIIRTGYGYHIVKVQGERPVENKIDVAHIIIMKSPDSITDEKLIQQAYDALQNGEPFAEVAKQFSQDGVTKNNGGQLGAIGRKDIPLKVFTDTAYELQEGNFSKPFQSDLGWHIVTLNKILPLPTKEEVMQEVKTFFASMAGNGYYNEEKHNRLLSKLDYQLLSDTYFEDLLSIVNRDYLMKIVEPILLSRDENKEMFKLNEQVYYYNDFLTFLSNKVQHATAGMRTEQILENAFEKYRNEQAFAMYERMLYTENNEYAAIIDEYNNGVLLFNVMQEQVWEMSGKDTIGQKEYYNKHQREFDLPERWEVAVYRVEDKVVAKDLYEKLHSGVEEKMIAEEFALKPVVEFWTNASEEIKIAEFKSGKTLTTFQEGLAYKVVQLYKHHPREKRDFIAAKNDVVQTYMLEYEKQWLEELRAKHKVKLKNNKWKKLKRNLIKESL